MQTGGLAETRILVTGACGFVGANLCRYFLERGAQVTALGRKGEPSWRLSSVPGLRTAAADLTDESAVKRLMEDLQPHVIFNCAAYGAYSSQQNPRRIYDVNFEGVRHLLEMARVTPGFKLFVQAGSSSEYGLHCTAPSESDSTIPDSHYAVSKVAATSLVQFYAKKLGVPAYVFRLYSVYGPYEDASRLIPKLLAFAREQKLPPLVNPRISRDFIYVDDVCEAYEKLLQHVEDLPKGEVYNIGTGVCTTLDVLVDDARRLFSIEQAPEWGSMPDRAWDNSDWYANPSKAKEHFGWSARTALSAGLTKTMNWIDHSPDLFQRAQSESVLASLTSRAQ